MESKGMGNTLFKKIIYANISFTNAIEITV